MSDAKILKQEMTKVQQAGWKCSACGVVNLMYGGVVPTNCINCTTTVLIKEWEHLLTTIETTESI